MSNTDNIYNKIKENINVDPNAFLRYATLETLYKESNKDEANPFPYNWEELSYEDRISLLEDALTNKKTL